MVLATTLKFIREEYGIKAGKDGINKEHVRGQGMA